MRTKGTPQELERRRRRAITLLQQGERVTDIARFLGLHTDTIYRWKALVDRHGPSALDPKPQPGRPLKLTPEQLTQLDHLLRQSAKNHGFPDPLWTGRRVQQLIARHFEVDYHVDHVRKLLKQKLRFSSQKPEKRAYQRDEWDIDFFRHDNFLDLLDHAAEHQAHLVFLDESGFQLTPNVRRGYAPRGHTPILPCSREKQRVSAISCVTVSPDHQDVELHFTLLDPNQNVCGEDIVTFLQELRTSIPRMLVVWDGATIHAQSGEVCRFLETDPAIDEETLPAYAPELNPDEYVWGYVKHSRLYHFAPTKVIDLYDRLEQEFVALSKQKDIPRGFINHSDLILRV